MKSTYRWPLLIWNERELASTCGIFAQGLALFYRLMLLLVNSCAPALPLNLSVCYKPLLFTLSYQSSWIETREDNAGACVLFSKQ